MNKVLLSGRVGIVEDKGNFVKVSLATTKKIKGEDVTQWHSCVAFGAMADRIRKYVGVGSKVMIDGELSYSTKDKVKYTSIIINAMDILTWKNKDKDNTLSSEIEVSCEYPLPSQSFDDDDIPF